MNSKHTSRRRQTLITIEFLITLAITLAVLVLLLAY
jgi:hypothetical protein